MKKAFASLFLNNFGSFENIVVSFSVRGRVEMKLLLSPTPNIFQFSGGLGTLTSKSYSTTMMVTFRGQGRVTFKGARN